LPNRADHAKPSHGSLFPSKDAAAFLVITERGLRKLRERGEIRAYRVGSSRSIRYRREDLEALLHPVDGRTSRLRAVK
jgi:excisionase family DNA binding protein